jgi:ATP-dependent Clp protease ATP-binding subunit ClpC
VSPSPDITEQEIRERCHQWIGSAIEEANRLRHDFIGTEHLFIALTQLDHGLTQSLLTAAGLDARSVRNDIRRDAGDVDLRPHKIDLPFTPRTHKVLAEAVQLADEYGDDVQEPHILMALLTAGVEGIPMRKLKSLNVNLSEWRAQTGRAIGNEANRLNADDMDPSRPYISPSLKLGREDNFFINDPRHKEDDADSSEDSSERSTPLLDKYGRDLTALAKQGKLSPVVGREREIKSVARTLTRNKKNNPLLLGDAGVGKTAVVEGLAQHIVNGTAPLPLRGKRIIQIEIGTLLAGTSLRGQFEERLVGIVDEARHNHDIILFIDEIHTIVGAGDTIDSNLDAANILKPALSRGEIVCIGATTHEEYRRAIAQDAALERRFRTVDVDEPSRAETLRILQFAAPNYANHHKVQILPDALTAAVDLSSRYLLNRRQPDKAFDLLDEACARLVIQTNTDEEKIVTAEGVATVLSEWVGIPITQLTTDERARYTDMEKMLRQRVIGQDHAVSALSAAIKTNRAGLSEPNRPVGVFLFLGPSGVGKTELAKALAAFLFGTEDALLRFDMSEFYDEHTVARLVGSPPGYKDSQRGGQLTEALRRRPYTVVLLDEVEKAAPQVFDIFLQIFDEGRITDSRGAISDARQAVWIMTSNIGTAENSKNSVGFAASKDDTSKPNNSIFQTMLKRHFRVEFLNRLDDIIIFNSLEQATLEQILELQLKNLRERLTAQNITFSLAEPARALLLKQGYDAANGARPLRRAINRLLVRPLSAYLLQNPTHNGTASTEIVIEVGPNETLTFRRQGGVNATRETGQIYS